jgi:ubiquinone/menaquinone biosynthesis C-methylase UbiE
MDHESNSSRTTFRLTLDVALEQPAAFDVFVADLASSLARLGIEFQPGEGGRVTDAGFLAGRVEVWRVGEAIRLEWHQASWAPEETTQVEARFEPAEGGTRVVLEHRGWGGLIADPRELVGWFASEMAAPAFRASAPTGFGDWLTDRNARRPSGLLARAVYGDPIYHYPNFRVILEELELTRDDRLVEVGCGGGAFLREALRTGCRASAVDHSADMVRLAREANRKAIEAGRLEIREAGAEHLPFADGTFTRAAMTGVLGFLSDPVAALREIRRVLRPGGRFVLLGSDPELRGTPAAPEPIASRLRFYDSAELERLGHEAGFDEVRVVRRSLERFAEASGVPREHLALFGGPGARFLLARRR